MFVSHTIQLLAKGRREPTTLHLWYRHANHLSKSPATSQIDSGSPLEEIWHYSYLQNYINYHCSLIWSIERCLQAQAHILFSNNTFYVLWLPKSNHIYMQYNRVPRHGHRYVPNVWQIANVTPICRDMIICYAIVIDLCHCCAMYLRHRYLKGFWLIIYLHFCIYLVY